MLFVNIKIFFVTNLKEENKISGRIEGREMHAVYWWGRNYGHRPFEGPRHRYEYNIKEDLKKIECKKLGWNNLPGDRDNWIAVLNMVVYVTLP
jgi:hypothetical protein